MTEPDPAEEDMTAIGDKWRGVHRLRELFEASSFGTPAARRLRERGARMLRGEPDPKDARQDQVYEDWAAGRIDDVEAVDRLTDAGLYPHYADQVVSGWRRP